MEKKWPYVAKSGRKSYVVGFRDHVGIERSKSFPAAKVATAWIEEFVWAERRGPDSLRRFLLDLDAKEANSAATGQRIGEVIQLYFAFNAPETADGLAQTTFRSYRHSANRRLLGIAGMSRGKPLAPAEHAVHFAAQPSRRSPSSIPAHSSSRPRSTPSARYLPTGTPSSCRSSLVSRCEPARFG